MTHLQGPVPLGDPSYIERPFERSIQRELTSGKWVLLLGPRQHGKTSALVRIKAALIEAGLHTALVDLQAAPPFGEYEEFVGWFCGIIGRQVGSDTVPAESQPTESKGVFERIFGTTRLQAEHKDTNDTKNKSDLVAMLESVLPTGNAPVIVLIDEASNIANTTWRNAFYGQLRSLSSRRAEAKPGDMSSRLRFVFAGTFRYETLIDEKNSPFNVCEHIYSDDLTLDDVVNLTATTLGQEHVSIAEILFDELGGQPFLIQRVLDSLEGLEAPAEYVEVRIQELRTGQSGHIEHLFGKVLAEAELATIVSRMAQEGAAPNEAADPNHRYLQVLGIAKREGSNLIFRNALYRKVATGSPQLGGSNDTAPIVPMFPKPINAFNKVQNAELREIACSAHNGAVAAYRGRSNRLALAGFGSSLEAILLDLLLRQPSGSCSGIAQRAKCNLNRFEDANDPETWRLVNLIKAGAEVGGPTGLEPPQTLREWRNIIHASEAKRNYRPDEDLEAEVRTAAGMHDIVLRDIP